MSDQQQVEDLGSFSFFFVQHTRAENIIHTRNVSHFHASPTKRGLWVRLDISKVDFFAQHTKRRR